jgi:hypothetical protein
VWARGTAVPRPFFVRTTQPAEAKADESILDRPGKTIPRADRHPESRGHRKLIGYDTIESDAVGSSGDRLYFDEECFLRGSSGRFQIDNVIPVSGRAVLAGSADDGRTLRDVATGIESLRSRLKYL